MNLAMNLQVRQSQSLTMTPQLLQSIRLLQFHHVELLAFLQQEADGNPLLELVPPAEPAPAAASEPVTDAPAIDIARFFAARPSAAGFSYLVHGRTLGGLTDPVN